MQGNYQRDLQSVQQGKEMIDAIEQGDSKVIVESIIDHWELSRDFLDYFVRPDPLPLELEDIINE